MITFWAENCRQFTSVDFERNVLEDDSSPDRANHLLEAGSSLHLSGVEDIGQLKDVLACNHDLGSENEAKCIYQS